MDLVRPSGQHRDQSQIDSGYGGSRKGHEHPGRAAPWTIGLWYSPKHKRELLRRIRHRSECLSLPSLIDVYWPRACAWSIIHVECSGSTCPLLPCV